MNQIILFKTAEGAYSHASLARGKAIIETKKGVLTSFYSALAKHVKTRSIDYLTENRAVNGRGYLRLRRFLLVTEIIYTLR